jgi:RNA polymerase sigma-70 factor, ECF subfamily
MSAAFPVCPCWGYVSATEANASAAALFEQHHEQLCRYLARFTGDADLAADIAQEAFVRFIEHAPDTQSAAPWLFRVATNLARDHARTGTRRRLLVMRGRAMLAHSDPPPAPDSGADRARARRMVNEAFDALSEKERMALLMREEGYAHREIAAALGTTTGSVGTLMARALRKAAARLREAQEDT